MLKAVILIGGPQKGTRFRPLSLDVPKPLFPVAGYPMIHHLIDACVQVEGLTEVLLIGSYQPSDDLNRFITSARRQFSVQIRYYQEYAPLGTAGGIYHFRDQILSGGPEAFFVLNCDVCGDFPLAEMLRAHRSRRRGEHHSVSDTFTMLITEATRQQSHNYGSAVVNASTNEVLHYVEKPGTFVSCLINCGVYIFSVHVFQHLAEAFNRIQETSDFRSARMSVGDEEGDQMSIATSKNESISLECDVLTRLAGTGKLFGFRTTNFWSQLKSTAAAIYANRHYLAIYHKTHPERLAPRTSAGPTIIGDVYIHETASVDASSVLGPNVSIGKGAVIGAGVRVRESIILEGAQIQDHACVLYSIVGWNSWIGAYSRIEGTPHDPNPNKPFSKIDILDLFSDDGRLNPSITVIGTRVQIPAEVVILNSIVLPHKEITGNIKNNIVL